MTVSTDESTEILRVHGLSSRFGTKSVLRDVGFNVRKGEIFVIMGASGSGKTTLLRHLVGLNKPHAGEITLLGKPLTRIRKSELYELRRHIGVAFQSGALINSMSVVENVELPLRQHTTLDKTTIRIMSRMKLDMMALAEAEDLMPAQLSGGMLKRTGLARAVIMDPQVLFFDEPSAGLDPVTSAELDDLIVGLRDALRMTVIVVTHELESALKIADRLMILADGGIAAIGTLDEIRRSKNESIQAMLYRRKGAGSKRLTGEEYLDHLTEDDDDEND
jgi:phospholipid/cholesterol/gamma-HCH transport system ATP-binding protein